MFFDALVGDETFAVEVVLKAGIVATRGAEVHQDPGADAAELGNPVEHGDLMAVDLGLVFLGPDGRLCAGWGVQAGFGAGSPLGHDEGFPIADVPRGRVGAGEEVLLVPADVFVGADDVESAAEWIVDDFDCADAVGIRLCADKKCSGDQAGGVELASEIGHGGEVFCAGWGAGGFVGDGPENNGGLVAVAANHLAKLLFGFGEDGGVIELEGPVDGYL